MDIIRRMQLAAMGGSLLAASPMVDAAMCASTDRTLLATRIISAPITEKRIVPNAIVGNADRSGVVVMRRTVCCG